MWALTIAACLLVTVYAESPGLKPGDCPTDLSLLGSQACVDDSGCPGSEKCCSNLCSQPVCDEDDSPAQCLEDPCAEAKCSKIPDAMCIAETCSDVCERFWYTKDGDVTDTCEEDENDDPMTRKEKKEARKARKEARRARKEARKNRRAENMENKEAKADKKEKKAARLAKKEEKQERREESKAAKLAKKAARKERIAGREEKQAAKKAKKMEKAERKAARQAKRKERQEKREHMKASKMDRKQARLDRKKTRMNKV